MADIADYSWEVSAHAYLPRFDNVRNSNAVYHRTIEYNAYYLSDSYLGHNDEQFSSEELQDIYRNVRDEIRDP